MRGVLSRFSLHIYKTILIILFQIVCNTTHAFNDFSTLVNPNYVENDVVSFDLIGQSLSFPAGGGEFGKGAIDLGGLKVYEALYFKKIWETHSGGPKGLGATFYEPTSIPTGFTLIGHYCKPNSKPMVTAVLVAKDTTGNPSHPALNTPIDYTLIWTSEGLNVSRQQDGYIWLPIAPYGYKAVGHIVTTSPLKPSLDKVRCVRADFTELTKVDKWIWGHNMGTSSSKVNLHTTKPKTRGRSVPTGMFLARNGSNTHELACLKMVKHDPYPAKPDSSQISAMINAYAPWVYFHPNEQYFPSSVLWVFENGAKLYQLGHPPSDVINDGDNLPNKGGADDAFLDLPSGGERLKEGFLSDAVVYIHVKQALGGTCTDLAIWLYYPFNGGGKLQLGPFTIKLGRIGEHVGDWEHITLRISNFHGNLKAVYLSQHAKGKWLAPSEFELMNGTRPVVYSSLHGHTHYSSPTSHTHLVGKLDTRDVRMLNDEFNKMNKSGVSIIVKDGSSSNYFGFGLKDEAAKSNNVMDIASSYNVICVDGKAYGTEPWVDYTGRWGPKFVYNYTEELRKIVHVLPGLVRRLVRKVMRKIPAEVFGQEGPQGPKMKDSWLGDERV